MHNAPPVVYPVGRFVWGRRVAWLLALVGAAGLLAWQAGSQATMGKVVLAWCVWSLSLAVAWGSLAHECSASGHLSWDGESWLWRDDAGHVQTVDVQVLLDVGHAICLRYEGSKLLSQESCRAQWAVLQAAAMPSSWHGFRCAVYSRPMEASMSADRYESTLKI